MRNLVAIVVLAMLGGCASLSSPDSGNGTEPTGSEATYSVVGDAPFPALMQDPLVVAQLSEEPVGPPDIWQRIRDGFSLPDIEHRRIDQQLDWYARNPEYMQRVVERARPYLYYVVETLNEYDLPMEIALLPIVESAYQPFAYSHGRASGIWQFIPATGRLYGLKQNWWYDGRRDIYASTRAAASFLSDMHDYYDGDWMHALASYNSGIGNVNRAIRRNRARDRSIDFFDLNLPRETEAYVPKLLALKKLIAHPEEYGIELDPIPDQPYFSRVELDGQIDLALAAELAEVDLDEIYRLNPGFNRWATAPNGPNYLLIPKDKAASFENNLASLDSHQLVTWQRHRVSKGETLSTIASRYHISVQTIQRLNHIRGHLLRIGQSLMIPVASKSPSSYRLSKAQRVQAQQNQPRQGNKINYVVKPGDTFWELAQQHGVSVRALARWNAMAPGDPLKAGQNLVIWSRRDQQAAISQGLIAPPQRSMTKRIGYRVRRGDSLSRISQKFRVSISQLRRWNNLPEGKYLQPGQRLTLYIDVMQTSS